MRTAHRSGLTLLELLVIIGVIGMLLALLVPGLLWTRGVPPRKAQCANNLRQVAQALQIYEANKRELPGRINELPVMLPGKSVPAYNTVSWIARILPQLERTDIYEVLQTGELTAATAEMIPRIDLIICPQDAQASAMTPGLSYVVNAGHWDRPGETVAGDYAENGLFFGRVVQRTGALGGWALATDSRISMSLNHVQDGLATTLLLSENVQAGRPDSPASPQRAPRSWLLSPTEQGDGFVWASDPAEQARINQGTEAVPDYKSPRHCRPASNHADGVNVAFCDGHNEFLRDDIDYKVYYQLMTPRGTKGKLPPNGADVPDEWREYHLNKDDYR